MPSRTRGAPGWAGGVEVAVCRRPTATGPRPRTWRLPRTRRGTPRRPDAAASTPRARAAGRRAPCASSSEPCASRTPTVTATSATDKRGDQLEDGRGREGDAEGPQRGDAVAVGDLGDAARLHPLPAVRHQCRQPPHDVDEVARQRLHGPPLLGSAVTGRESDERAEDRDEGQRRQDDDRAEQVLGRHRDHRQRWQHGGQHQRRHVAGEVGLAGRDPAGHQDGDLAAAARAGSVHRRRP